MTVRFRALRRLARQAMAARARYRDWLVRRRPHHALAVCAIFREEAPFLDEWLRFHHGVGAGHFYLYNNFSSDDFQSVLQPWIARGLVTLRDWPHPVGQLAAYRHCIETHWRDAARIAFIDIDEFLFSPETDDIRLILRDYHDVPGLLVYGTFFGASGHAMRPAGALVEAYTRRAPVEFACSGKTIANPRHVRAVNSVHGFQYWTDDTRDTSRRTHSEGREDPVFDKLRFNHYWSRSIEDLQVKVGRGDASTPQARDLAWHLEYESRLNDVEDRAIFGVARRILGVPFGG